MQKLVPGLHALPGEIFAPQRALFARLSRARSGEALFITCSDSRVDPALLTQTDPGGLFVVRNAGNIVPRHGAAVSGGEAAAVELAVAALGVRDIIVCGHSSCGTLAALLAPAESRHLPAVATWLEEADATRRIMATSYGHLTGDALLAATVEEHVLVQLESLRTHPAVAARLAREEVHLHGWVYEVESGLVFSYSPGHGQFTRLGPAWQPVIRLSARGGTPSRSI